MKAVRVGRRAPSEKMGLVMVKGRVVAARVAALPPAKRAARANRPSGFVHPIAQSNDHIGDALFANPYARSFLASVGREMHRILAAAL